jgi:hypothetical protein
VYPEERELWSKANADVLYEWRMAHHSDDPFQELRMLKWHFILPQLLLRTSSNGRKRTRERRVIQRLRRFEDGDLATLLEEWQRDSSRKRKGGRREGSSDLDAAMELLRHLQYSKAVRLITSSGLGDLLDSAILAQMDRKHPERRQPISSAALAFRGDELELECTPFIKRLKRWKAAGVGGLRNEHLFRAAMDGNHGERFL